MADLFAPAFDWATAAGPPNWLFVVAILTSPVYWSGYVKEAVKKTYSRYVEG